MKKITLSALLGLLLLGCEKYYVSSSHEDHLLAPPPYPVIRLKVGTDSFTLNRTYPYSGDLTCVPTWDAAHEHIRWYTLAAASANLTDSIKFRILADSLIQGTYSIGSDSVNVLVSQGGHPVLWTNFLAIAVWVVNGQMGGEIMGTAFDSTGTTRLVHGTVQYVQIGR